MYVRDRITIPVINRQGLFIPFYTNFLCMHEFSCFVNAYQCTPAKFPCKSCQFACLTGLDFFESKHFAKDHWQDRLQPSPVPQGVPATSEISTDWDSFPRNRRPQAPQIAISKAVRWRARSWVVQGPSQRLHKCSHKSTMCTVQ